MKQEQMRKWQRDCFAALVLGFRHRKDFLVTATPGGGKTKLALAFAKKLVQEGDIDHVHVVTPTRPLKKQWVEEALGFGLLLGNRSNDSLRNQALPFDIGGVVATYSQIAKDAFAHASCLVGRKALVICDECHHAGEQLEWGEAIKDAFAGARFRLSLSGTPFRSDGNVIPFVEYDHEGYSKTADGCGFKYGYSTAIADDVCRPCAFRWYNALVNYEAKGRNFSVSFSDTLPKEQMSDRLRFALHPDAGLVEQMVRDADAEILSIRALGGRFSDAAGLLVAMTQAHAYACARLVAEVTGEKPMVVVSDNETSEDDLVTFRNGRGRWLIAVRMVSEGIDIPRLMIAVYATNVIATLFFRQLVGRVVRVRHRGMEETANIFLPGDERLKLLGSEIEEEVHQFLKDESDNKFPSLRRAMARNAAEQMVNVPHCQVTDNGVIYRGEHFTEEDLKKAERERERYQEWGDKSIEQVAFLLRQILRDHRWAPEDEGE